MNKRILLIEDEPGLVLTLTDRLTSKGYLIEAATDGETGLDRATNAPFDPDPDVDGARAGNRQGRRAEAGRR